MPSSVGSALAALKAAAPTDYWRKPPDIDVSNAPTALSTVSVKTFRRARVTVSADWTRLYDQGGIFVSFPKPLPDGRRCWLKTGIEYYGGRTCLSTVAAREWADWSLIPMPSPTTSVTIEIEREAVDAASKSGSSLWVYLVEGERRAAVREITWAFEGVEDTDTFQVGLYAARPTKADPETGEELHVTFADWKLEGEIEEFQDVLSILESQKK